MVHGAFPRYGRDFADLAALFGADSPRQAELLSSVKDAMEAMIANDDSAAAKLIGAMGFCTGASWIIM